MKTLVVLAIALAMVSGAAFADTSGKASAVVMVNVDPNVSVGVLTSIVSAGTVQTGNFTADVLFRVDANNEQVNLSAEASPLYKGLVTSTDVLPIPIALSEGVVISPADALPFVGSDNVAQYISGGGGSIDGYPTVGTEIVGFESSQNGHFSQNVQCTYTWDQNDPEKPQGEYQGRVGITAMLLP